MKFTMPAGRPLPREIKEQLANPPEEGTGVHNWIHSLACSLCFWRTKAQSIELLAAATAHCVRDRTREVDESVEKAFATKKSNPRTGGRSTRPPKGPYKKKGETTEVDQNAINAIKAQGLTRADLMAMSPDSVDTPTNEVVRSLYHGDPLLCMAHEVPQQAKTKLLSDWLKDDLSRFALMVPSPMTAPLGKAQSGKDSPRCLDNTGPRAYLVVEFDFKHIERAEAADLCAGIIIHLHQQGHPLALAVYSGGKSVHAWFPTRGGDIEPLWQYCLKLGADPATKILCQLIRVPGGTREDGTRQSILYYDHAATGCGTWRSLSLEEEAEISCAQGLPRAGLSAATVCGKLYHTAAGVTLSEGSHFAQGDYILPGSACGGFVGWASWTWTDSMPVLLVLGTWSWIDAAALVYYATHEWAALAGISSGSSFKDEVSPLRPSIAERFVRIVVADNSTELKAALRWSAELEALDCTVDIQLLPGGCLTLNAAASHADFTSKLLLPK
jgi:hypothetical protein